MYFFSKKKIACFLFAIITITVGFEIYNMKREERKTVATVALPVTNKVIVIDAGHGRPDRRSL